MRKGLVGLTAVLAISTGLLADNSVLREDLRTVQEKTGAMDALSKEVCKGNFQSDAIKTFKCFEQHVRAQEILDAKALTKAPVTKLVGSTIWGKMTMTGTDNYTDTSREDYVICEVRANEEKSNANHKLIERQCYTPNYGHVLRDDLWGRSGYYTMDKDSATGKWFVTGYIGR